MDKKIPKVFANKVDSDGNNVLMFLLKISFCLAKSSISILNGGNSSLLKNIPDCSKPINQLIRSCLNSFECFFIDFKMLFFK